MQKRRHTLQPALPERVGGINFLFLDEFKFEQKQKQMGSKHKATRYYDEHTAMNPETKPARLMSSSGRKDDALQASAQMATLITATIVN
jgi:hypothetical protein